VHNLLKHRTAEQAVAVVEGADLAGGEGALGLLEDEFRPAVAKRVKSGPTGRTAVARLRLECAGNVQRGADAAETADDVQRRAQSSGVSGFRWR
jgi:hypothetical protein